VTVPEAFRCRCTDWPLWPCGRRMTQEDLLCDGCRGVTCSVARFGGTDPIHLRQAPEIAFGVSVHRA